MSRKVKASPEAIQAEIDSISRPFLGRAPAPGGGPDEAEALAPGVIPDPEPGTLAPPDEPVAPDFPADPAPRKRKLTPAKRARLIAAVRAEYAGAFAAKGAR